jgi:acyl-CoA synthetase (AMP-forming)/AMP-acid ligase II
MENNGVGSWLRRRRPKSGPKPALIYAGAGLSYDGLAERADRLANALRAHGYLQRCPWWQLRPSAVGSGRRQRAHGFRTRAATRRRAL